MIYVLLSCYNFVLLNVKKNQIMKNVITNTKKGILIVTLMVASLSFATDAPFFIVKNDAKRTSLTLEKVKSGNLLSIKDNNGIVLYKELIQKNGIYTKGFDLTALPDGTYIFELDGDTDIKTIPFKVSSNEVIFNKNLEKTSFKPVTRVKGNLVYVTKLALNKEPLKVDVYFGENNREYELMYSETIEKTQKIERVYKLTGMDKGNYKLVFNTEGREFTEIIN